MRCQADGEMSARCHPRLSRRRRIVQNERAVGARKAPKFAEWRAGVRMAATAFVPVADLEHGVPPCSPSVRLYRTFATRGSMASRGPLPPNLAEREVKHPHLVSHRGPHAGPPTSDQRHMRAGNRSECKQRPIQFAVSFSCTEFCESRAASPGKSTWSIGWS